MLYTFFIMDVYKSYSFDRKSSTSNGVNWLFRVCSHWALSNNVNVSDAKKFVEYPFLAMLANAIAKSSMSTEP